jgi:hypothetical protein
MRFAGKKRNEVSNPCLTAREAIVIADHIAHAAAVSAVECAPLIEEIEVLRQDGSRLTAENARLREALEFIAGHNLNGADDRAKAIICGLFIIKAKKAIQGSQP